MRFMIFYLDCLLTLVWSSLKGSKHLGRLHMAPHCPHDYSQDRCHSVTLQCNPFRNPHPSSVLSFFIPTLINKFNLKLMCLVKSAACIHLPRKFYCAITWNPGSSFSVSTLRYAQQQSQIHKIFVSELNIIFASVAFWKNCHGVSVKKRFAWHSSIVGLGEISKSFCKVLQGGGKIVEFGFSWTSGRAL